MGKAELDSTVDYYRILEISFPSTQVDIRRAFLELARTQHPDKNPGREIEFKAKFQAITTAYDVLKDPTLKRTYDQIRPIVRKPVATQRPTASSRPSPAGAKAASEAAARASAFPRQAKANFKGTPKSPPKKSQTQRKDPFFDWTPPIPRNKPTATRTTTRPETTYYKEHLNETTTNSQPFSSPRRAPTAARTSAYSATRNTPPRTQEPVAGFKPSIPHKSKPSPQREARTGTGQFNTPGERGWWAQSSTAYSTFHAPSSKYSPYTADTPQGSPSFTSNAREKPTRTSPTQARSETKKAFPSDASHRDSAHEPLRPVDYSWQNSRGAYQRKNTDASFIDKRPKKEPRSRKAANPSQAKTFFSDTQRKSDSSPDSDLGDHGVASTEPSKQSPVSNSRKSTFKAPQIIESSDSDADFVTSGTNSDSDSESDASATFAVRKKRAEQKQKAEEKLPSTRVFHKFRPAFSTPGGHSDVMAKEGSTSVKADRYSFSFRPSPASSLPGSASSRKSSGSVPYVRLNKVPDFNFASPTVQFESPGSSSSAKKEAQLKDQVFSSNQTPTSKSDTTNTETDLPASQKLDSTHSLADQLSRVGLGNKSSPLKFSFETDSSKPTTQAQKADSKDTNVSEAPISTPKSKDSVASKTRRNPFSFDGLASKTGEARPVSAFTFPKPSSSPSIFSFEAKSGHENVPPIFNFNNSQPIFDSKTTSSSKPVSFAGSTSATPPIFKFSDSSTNPFGSTPLPPSPSVQTANHSIAVPLPPVAPQELLKHDSLPVDDAQTYRREYLAKSALFETYFEAWRGYRAAATWDASYLDALKIQQTVREAHGAFEKEHMDYIQRSLS